MGTGTVRNRNGKDVREAEEIRKGLQEFTEKLYKNCVNDLDSHNGVVTHLEPGMLECEVKWDLRSITVNKAIGRDGIPVYGFKILKADVVKVLHSICQQIWKNHHWSQKRKISVFISIPKKGNAKNNVQATI